MTEGEAKLLGSGEKLAGKYSIVRVIGEGGMGVVYEARHDRLGQRVAIKMLRDGERHNPEVVARFEREARLVAKLKSANAARVTDVDTLPDGTPFMVMEYLEGVDLDFELAERGRLPVREAVGYVLQACSAVAEAHSLGIVHRDLKPHNLFLTQDGERRVVKLLDFGISKLTVSDEESVTLTRSSLGTPLYMSPEQIRSARNADQRSDLWSLGVILYELTTGSPPFDGDGPAAVIASITADAPKPPMERRPELGQALSDVILRALEKEPAKRFASVVEFAEALTAFGSAGSWAPPPTASQPRITIPDMPRISADAITLLDPGAGRRDSLLRAAESQAPLALSHRAPPPVAKGARVRLAAIVVGALAVGAAGAFLLAGKSEHGAPLTAAERAPTPSATIPAEPSVARPVMAPLVTPVPSSEPIASATSAKAKAPAVRGARPPAPPSSAGHAPAPSAPAPLPKPAENPLHL